MQSCEWLRDLFEVREGCSIRSVWLRPGGCYLTVSSPHPPPYATALLPSKWLLARPDLESHRFPSPSRSHTPDKRRLRHEKLYQSSFPQRTSSSSGGKALKLTPDQSLCWLKAERGFLSCGGCQSEHGSNNSAEEVSGKEPLMAHTISGKHWREHLPSSVFSSLTAALFVGLMWCLPHLPSYLFKRTFYKKKKESRVCCLKLSRLVKGKQSLRFPPVLLPVISHW